MFQNSATQMASMFSVLIHVESSNYWYCGALYWPQKSAGVESQLVFSAHTSHAFPYFPKTSLKKYAWSLQCLGHMLDVSETVVPFPTGAKHFLFFLTSDRLWSPSSPRLNGYLGLFSRE